MLDRRFRRYIGKCLLPVALSMTLFVLITTVVANSPSPDENIWREYRDQVAPPVPPPIHTCWFGNMCSGIVTGTSGGTWVIKGPNEDLEHIQEYRTATFEQSIVDRSDGSVTVKIRSDAFLETEASYPLDTNTLPSDIQTYLEPDSDKQSDAGVIVQQAQQLVEDAETEAQAVVAILDWVRGNIAYDYTFSLPRDALSVYQNKSGVCEGFSNLSVALLRAAGIPARVQSGCALWALPEGGGHAWIEVYYPDLGWVPSEPQNKENYLDQHLVAPRWWAFCGKDSTNITYTERLEAPSIYDTRTPYDDSIWPYLTSAGISSWDRNPARSSVHQLSAMVSVSETQSTHHLEVESTHCYSTSWILESSVPWVNISPAQGNERTEVTVSVDTSALSLGVNSGVVTMVTPLWWSKPGVREIPVNVWVVENLHETFLPLVTREASID